MARIAVVGSLNMDLVAKVAELPSRGETVRAKSFQANPGGKGANQAVAAARLGADVKMVGRVGVDSYGEILLSNLVANGVDASYVLRDPTTPTGLGLITVDDEGLNTIVVFPGANGKCQSHDVRTAEGIIAESQAVVIQLEIPLDVAGFALRLAKVHSVMTVLNPAPVHPLLKEFLPDVDFLIANEVEAASLCGFPVSNPETALQAAEKILGMGVRRVVMTLGERGVVFTGPEGRLYVPAFPVEAVDTTGAGDAFIAAFTVSWIRGLEVERCLRYACAAAALTITQMGAQSSLPLAQDVDGFLKERGF